MTARATVAATEIGKRYRFRGSADPGYIANVIDAELERFDADPDAPVVERPWDGNETMTGMTMRGMIASAAGGSSERAAQAAAIRIVMAYATAIADTGTPYVDALDHIAGVIDRAKGMVVREDVELLYINAHRRSFGQPPLDPVASDWGPSDVTAEVRRIRQLRGGDKWFSAWSNPEFRAATMVALEPGEVFAKVTSHRGWGNVTTRLGYKPQTYVSLRRKKTAATYFFIVPPADFEKIKDIRGVGRTRFRAADEWFKPMSFLNPIDQTKARLLAY